LNLIIIKIINKKASIERIKTSLDETDMT